ncbi:wax ester/triacylglycerol synthase domain-containing protein [Streptomyces sp. SP18CS02]|uniref:wax ester/triacylglycerol synthase domain-containing protein n=1 Tax=Streptomyces sp. SP18CS02 TaxID=3002531 RepID=UPI002E770715|nr:wax ester/triacylglycerol synthase domain-containing protein [Streptomyces sp. SP18CS02]MEE1752118.1 wax ester/triacylglycerol synthase family O-acyltransferase [Streptomyces sp. SP18CS02]
MTHCPNPVDGCFLTYEQEHSGVHPYIGAVLHATGTAPKLSDVREQIAGRIDRMPSLVCRVSKQGRRTVWDVDPDFDPGRHVHEILLPDGVTSPDQTVEALLCEPMAEDAPRWGVWLIHGYSGGEYVLFYRAHHAAQDGQALLDAVTTLFGAGPPVAPRRAVVTPPVRRPWRSRIPARAIGRNMVDLARGLRSTMTWSKGRPLTGQARIVSASVPLPWLRETARVLGATPNDICLAALAEALRTWLPEDRPAGRGRRDLHVGMPVTLRYPEERYSVGNRVSAVRIPLSFWADSSTERVAAIARATRRIRTDGMRRVLRAQTRLPEWLLYRFALQAANVRSGLDTSGLVRVPGRLAMGDDPIEVVVPTLFLHGEQPFAVSFLSYRGQALVSLTIDRALADADGLATLWAAAVERLWREATTAAETPPRVPTG